MPCQLPPRSLIRPDALRLSRVALRILSGQEVEPALIRVPWDDPEGSVSRLKEAVKRGEVIAIGAEENGALAATCFGRVETRCGVRTFRILGAESKMSETWNRGLPFLEEFARQMGCAFIVTETSRAAVALAHQSAGYLVTDIVMAKDLR